MRSVIYGTAAVVHDGFDVDRVAESLEGDGVTLISVVATQLIRLLEADVDLLPLRAVLVGGGPVPEDVLAEALGPRRHGGPDLRAHRDRLAGDDAVARPTPARRLGSAGRSLLTTHLRIQDGEILVQGPTVAPGVADEDGWLHTGDLGRIDEDGFLYVTGRLGDVIVSGGENVLPTEVEEVLLRHPEVADAAVVGRADREWQEAVTAVVVPRGDREPSADDLRAHCAVGARRPQGAEAVRVRLRAAADGVGEAAPPGAAVIDRATVDRWLDDYVAAWKCYDREAIAALFTPRTPSAATTPTTSRSAAATRSSNRGSARGRRAPSRDREGTYDASYRPVAIDGDLAVVVGDEHLHGSAGRPSTTTAS